MSEPTLTAPSAPAVSSSALRGLRRIAVVAIIVSLSLTALVGIVTLLTATFGELQGKVVLTTLLVAAFSITALCHLAVVGRALRIVGWVGIGASGVALILGVVLIWGSWENWNETWDDVLKAFATASVVAVSLAHANLLLLLAERRSPVLRTALFITVGLIGLLALLIILPIVTEGEIPGQNGELYFRVLGVVAILDALGTIVLPVINRVTRGSAHGLGVRLGPDAAGKVVRLASARGLTPDEFVELVVTALPESDEPAGGAAR
jgi:hypothetical protein